MKTFRLALVALAGAGEAAWLGGDGVAAGTV